MRAPPELPGSRFAHSKGTRRIGLIKVADTWTFGNKYPDLRALAALLMRRHLAGTTDRAGLA
jgi:hypothetical protein